MAHIVLKYTGSGNYAVGWPAADLTDEDVAARAAEYGLHPDTYVEEALKVQANGKPYYTLGRSARTEYADAVPTAEAPSPPDAPKRKG